MVNQSIKNSRWHTLVEFGGNDAIEHETEKKMAIIEDDKNNMEQIEVDNDRGYWHKEWVYKGKTPVMQAIAENNVDRFKMFLASSSPEDIYKQIKTLRVMAACEVLDGGDEAKLIHYLLHEYEQKKKNSL